MKLAHFRIGNYKIVAQSEPMKVDRRVTALVGKNEGGKTAVLHALWKSRNVAGGTFDKLYDYPRVRYSVDRKDTQEITALEFELSSQETIDLIARVPQLTVTEQVRVIYRTFYEGEDGVRRDIQILGLSASGSGMEAIAAIEDFMKLMDEEPADDYDAVRESANDALDRIEENLSLWAQPTVQALESVSIAVAAWVDADPERKQFAATERERLSETVARARQGDPLVTARAWVEENLPTFIYFENYGQLETRIYLPSYVEQAAASDPRIRTQTALFEWSRLDPTEILALGLPAGTDESPASVHRRQEKRRALLDAASFALTGEWMEWWAGKRHKMHFEVEGEELVLKVSDENNEVPVPFGERSHGFRWFFSFCLIHLVEVARSHDGAILLFDEPGLHLHPTMQIKLLDLFERISDSNQILYTTHLPFLVDGRNLNRVRTVFLEGSEPWKASISNSLRPTGERETLYPVQAALGYSIAQSLFMGKRTVVVEEITDYLLIRTLNTVLPEVDGRGGLHEDIVVIPVGEASRLIPFVSVMVDLVDGSDSHLIVLLGSAPVGDEVARRMDEVFGEEPSVLMMGDVLDIAGATIEDLIPRRLYADVAIGRDGREISLDHEEQEAPTNLVAMHMVHKRLNRGAFGRSERTAAALALCRALVEPDFVPEFTRERGRSLVNAINGRFSRLP
jgi:predicted ATPase